MELVNKIGHGAIRARDAEKTADFYKEILGFKEAFRMYREDGSLSTIYLYVGDGGFLEIFSGGINDVALDFSSIGYCHVCYEVDDIEKVYQAVQEKGAPIDVPLRTGMAKCLLFYTHDPDGNAVELMELPPESLQAQAKKRLEGEA
ncbi:MAG: VOC family protein [Lachnospiraceae bacterium]|nr:VOC family protein [Lachnospiraceae bacterium]